MDQGVVGLAAAIDALRRELTEAMDAGQDQRMQFQVDPVELTVQAAVTKDASGKLGWKILELGGKRESVVTQTLVLRLAPVWRTLEGHLTRDFTVSSIVPTGDNIGPH